MRETLQQWHVRMAATQKPETIRLARRMLNHGFTEQEAAKRVGLTPNQLRECLLRMGSHS